MNDKASHLKHGVFALSPAALRKRIARRAREARLVAGHTQSGLAAAAGISRPTVQRFEGGEIVSIDVLVRVAIALHAEHDLLAVFALPDLRTVDAVLQRQKLSKRAGRN